MSIIFDFLIRIQVAPPLSRIIERCCVYDHTLSTAQSDRNDKHCRVLRIVDNLLDALIYVHCKQQHTTFTASKSKC